MRKIAESKANIKSQYLVWPLLPSESLEGDVPEQVEKDFVPEINNSTGRYLVGDLMSFGHYMLKTTAMG